MNLHPHLDDAPIQEALIDIRATLAADLDVQALRDLGSPEPGFPKIQPAKRVEAHVDKQASVRSSVTTRGILFRSEDDQRIAQFRTDGFTFNWLRPYSTWGEFASQAQRFWEHYRTNAQPREITRVAVRFINRFPVDVPVELGKVFTVPLALPKGVEGAVSDFLYRTTFRDVKTGMACSMTLTGERRPPETVDFIFDIDCFKGGTYAASDPEVWEGVLPSLRELKNRVFFAGLTPAMIERFK